MVTNPPILQLSECSRVKGAPQAQCSGSRFIGNPYRIKHKKDHYLNITLVLESAMGNIDNQLAATTSNVHSSNLVHSEDICSLTHLLFSCRSLTF